MEKIKTKNNTYKKRFLFNKKDSNPILAVGVIFTKTINDKKHLLVQEILHHELKKNINKLTDFGGKVDETDTSPINTLARELHEESNGSFYYENNKKDYLSIEELQQLIQNHKFKIIYSERSKYLLYFVNFPSTLKIDYNKAGDYEQLDKIKRKVKWVSKDEFLSYMNKKKIHYRLFDRRILNFIKKIEK